MRFLAEGLVTWRTQTGGSKTHAVTRNRQRPAGCGPTFTNYFTIRQDICEVSCPNIIDCHFPAAGARRERVYSRVVNDPFSLFRIGRAAYLLCVHPYKAQSQGKKEFSLLPNPGAVICSASYLPRSCDVIVRRALFWSSFLPRAASPLGKGDHACPRQLALTAGA